MWSKERGWALDYINYVEEGSSKSGYQQINIDYKNTAHSLGFPSQGGTQWTLQGSVEPIQ